MDEYVGKTAARGHSFPSRGSAIAFRDHNQEHRGFQNDRRLECSNRVSSTRGSQIGTPGRPKHTRTSFHSMSGKAIAGSSSKPFCISSSHRKSFQEQLDQTFLQESAVAESSCRQQIDDIDRNDGQVPIDNLDSDGRQERKVDLESTSMANKSLKSSLFKGVSTDMTKSANRSSRVHKQINGQLVSATQEASSSSFNPCSTTASKNSTHAARSFSRGLGIGAPRIDMVRKKPCDGGSSAARSMGSNASSSGGYSGSTRTEISFPNLSIPGQIIHQPISRIRNRLTIRDGPVSVRRQQTSPGDGRMRPSAEVDGSTLPLDESIAIPQLQQIQFSIPEAVRESSSSVLSTDLLHVLNNSSGRPSSSSRIGQSRSVSHPEDITQIAHGSSGDRHGYRHLNVEGVAEVLLALEQIEQDEELTYEQLLFLETNLLFGALSLHDQHRDMRMDIDNMSYEELLALEEKMGTVSTALTEEQLSKCLKRSTYTYASLVPEKAAPDNDNVICSICQEEYIGGDEVGRLPCEHCYHVACVHEWLQLKNWCPICKASALPS